MKKFKYLLVDTPNYPQFIYANSAKEVKDLLMENLASESSIISITEEVPPNAQPQPRVQMPQPQPPQTNVYFESSNVKDDVVVSSMNKFATGNCEANNDCSSISFPAEPQQKQIEQPTIENIPAKYFEEGGIKFKFENGKLYRKVFEKVEDDELSEYRLLNKNGKQVQLDTYSLEHLIWKEI